MVVVGILTIPTLITHWAPRMAQHIPPARSRIAFATMLVAFATWFLVHQLT